jgi:hypothetical protein
MPKLLSSTWKTIFLLCCLNTLTTVSAQTFYIPRDVRQAYDRQTRSTSGKPGERYWQNRAAYKIEVAIAPHLKKVTGTETITYTNHSPDTLASIYLKLIQNIHRPETFKVAFGEDKDFQTNGMIIESIKVNGKMTAWDNEKVWAGPDPVNAPIGLPAPLLPGGQITVDIHWEYELQTSENHREGMTDSTSFFCAYWYPRISVYDDVNGWDRVPFNDQIEFYNEFSDYDVTIRVPKNFIVWATGELQNADEVLEDRFVRLLTGTIVSDSPVKVITPADLRAGNITRNKPQLSWHFIAKDVTDFAFGSSDHYLWEASSVIADAVNYRRVSVQTAYKETSEDYPAVLEIARKSIQYFSSEMPGVPYPYPVMTVFNGFGQMEYPMMCNDVEQSSLDDTHTLTAHEIAHTYFPFLTGTNEGRYAWMDEGWATFLEYHACTKIFNLEDPFSTFPGYYSRHYLPNKTLEAEVPLLTPSHQMLSPSYGINAYFKAGSAYAALNSLLGDEMFKKCLQGYIERWRGKHPTPYDFFFTFNDLSGQDLNWFWKRWFMEYNTMDLSLVNVKASENGKKVTVTVRNDGGKPLPVTLVCTLADGSLKVVSHSPGVWKSADIFSTRLSLPSGIVKLELKDGVLLDVDMKGNVWEKNNN